jgi:ubiquitin-protein ligase
MASPRIKRLESDYEQLRSRFDGHPYITVHPIGVLPAERYRVVYKVPSLRLDPQNRPIISQVTVVDFELPSGYPKEKPRAVTSEQIFHPNFGDYVCIADFWSPAQSLSDIVIEVGEMLQWQKYNILSPLNAVAADWAVSQRENLPVGNIDLFVFTASPKISLKNQEAKE